MRHVAFHGLHADAVPDIQTTDEYCVAVEDLQQVVRGVGRQVLLENARRKYIDWEAEVERRGGELRRRERGVRYNQFKMLGYECR